MHGWTEEYVKYLDYITQIDISHEAPYKQRNRFINTIFMRGVDSNTYAGPLCQRPEFKSIAHVFVSIQREKGKGVPHIPMQLRTWQRDTLDPTVQQRLERFKLSTWIESPTWWRSSSRDHQWQEWSLKDGTTKNGGISGNPDNARVTHRLLQRDLYGDIRAKRSRLLSSPPESGFHSKSCALLRNFCSFCQFRVR